ncbi:hypothetical protein [Brevibacterium sp.]|uniref:hypothetical protein n=1 Tax=Brevibacterium sp. TaxID=1701 RepID=UPI0028125F7A|nr:hypothetical protein [Brevibacterium sp.]
MNAALLAAAAEGTEHAAHAEPAMAPILYGLITLSILISMAVVSRSWKGIAFRH